MSKHLDHWEKLFSANVSEYTGGALLNSNVKDLSQEPYGISDNCSGKFKTMWVYKSSGMKFREEWTDN